MESPEVVQISEWYVKPKHHVEESKQPCHLSPWDIAMLCVHYIQKGFLFKKTPSYNIDHLLTKLNQSLSVTLVHFYPLAGRFATLKQDDPPSSVVYIDCNKGPGARLVHASVDMTVSDVVSPTDVPMIVQSFFDHDRAVGHDGHTRPLLTIQVTELIDGVFIGCSINHAVVDGTSFWLFLNAFSEIFMTDEISIARVPIHTRRFPDGRGPIIRLPYTDPDEFVSRYEAPELRERVFHFSAESMKKLKIKANTECKTSSISSFQALSALMWRTITRARCFSPDQKTCCRLAINNRLRLNPQLPQNYFGNCIQVVTGTTTSGELLEHDLGWAAWKLHCAVHEHNDKAARDFLDYLIENNVVYQLGKKFDPSSVMMGSSPRFDMYGNEFGLGKAVALRSGYANKFSGKVSSYPGVEGGGSVDLEICVPPHTMAALEIDEEFLDAVCN